MTKRSAQPEKERQPLYMQLVVDVRSQIKDGALTPGDQVGPARVLAEKHGVSIITAQKALGELQSIGLVHAIPGKGSYVAADALDNLPASEPYTVRQNEIILMHHAQLEEQRERLDETEAVLKAVAEEMFKLRDRVSELEARRDTEAEPPTVKRTTPTTRTRRKAAE